MKSSRIIGNLGSLPFVIKREAHNATIGTQMVQLENAPNRNPNNRTTRRSITWVEPDLASGMPILAIRILPPGNVGMGSSDTHPRNERVIPALVKG